MLSAGFILMVFSAVVLFYLGTGRNIKGLIFFTAWAITVGLLSYLSFFKTTDTIPPRIVFAIIPAILYAIFFIKKMNVRNVKMNYLVAIHVLRLPVEVTLYQLFLQQKIPVLMTFEGYNFDIFMGITAVIWLVYLFFNKRDISNTFFRLWNIAGLFFLTIIVVLAILSAPSPFQKLAFTQPNIAILEFPFTLLPAVVVPIVYLSHLLCLKAIGFLGKNK